MKAGTIYSKTMPFVWAKLLLGLATVVASAVLFAILIGIGLLIKSDTVIFIMFVIWLTCTGILRGVILHYFGYLIKAGHIAVITEAVVTGRIPENQIAYGKQMVKERFATASVYFLIDKLVTGAVKQIQRGIGKVGNLLSFIPGMSSITSLAQFFVELSLGYVDECCLGYTFFRKEQGAFKSATDGVVIYAQNWKKLLGSAAKTMFMVILALIVITLVLFLLLGLLFRAFALPDIVAYGVALIVAFLLAASVKSAFIDSFILTRSMVAYMEVAPSTVITFDLYGKLSGLSSKFKNLFAKGQQEDPTPQYAYAGAGAAYAGNAGAAYAGAGSAYNGTGQQYNGNASAYNGAGQQYPGSAPAYNGAGQQYPGNAPAYNGAGQQYPGNAPAYNGAGQQYPGNAPAYNNAQQQYPATSVNTAEKPVFCGQCGAKNTRGVKFCQNCGNRMQG